MNPAHGTNWLPGLWALGASVILAALYLLFSRKGSAPATEPETLDDFEARYQAQLAQLKEHLANQHLQAPADFEREKQRLELAAANTLKARNTQRHEETKRHARQEKMAQVQAAAAQKNPWLTGALVGGGAVAFFAFVGFQLMQTATEQPPRAMPQGQGGNAGLEPQADPKLEALATRVQNNPDDGEALADLSVHLLRRQAFAEARTVVARTTVVDPYQPKGRVGRAVMKAVDGDMKGAVDDLEALAARYPEAYDATMFAGMIAMELNDSPRALRNLEAYITRAPAAEQPPMMRMAVTQLKQQLALPGQ